MERIFKCKNCGADIDLSKAVNGIVECDFCFSKFTVPKKDISPVALSFLRQGEHDLATCKFDDAYTAYSKATEYDSQEPEAYWGMALAEFKVQYIKDTANNRLQPICHEFTDKQFTQNKNYLSALKFATQNQIEQYIKKAQEIDYIRSEFLKLQQTGLDYDCFICVKVSRIDSEQVDNSKKNWTDDAYDADAIYDLLKRNGYTPFFSEREIRGRTGADYEAMILYALYTSETMLVVCHNEEYLQTRWVKNEYTRFKELVNNKEKENDSLTIVYNGTPIERLPGFSGKIQGIDYSRRSADFDIVKFVENHTPLAKARREEEARLKREREEDQKHRFEEVLEQQERQRKDLEERNRVLEERLNELSKSRTTVDAGLSDEDLLNRLDRARQEKERKAREEAERKAKEEAEYKARIEQEKRALYLKDFEISQGVLIKYKGNNVTVTIPDGVNKIGKQAFCDNRSLTCVIIPRGVKEIDESAFKNCRELVSIILQDGVEKIGHLAFEGCGITRIIIPDSVTYIGNCAFAECKLTSITIPKSVTHIGGFVFLNCHNLSFINCKAERGLCRFGPCWNAKYMKPGKGLEILEQHKVIQ